MKRSTTSATKVDSRSWFMKPFLWARRSPELVPILLDASSLHFAPEARYPVLGNVGDDVAGCVYGEEHCTPPLFKSSGEGKKGGISALAIQSTEKLRWILPQTTAGCKQDFRGTVRIGDR